MARQKALVNKLKRRNRFLNRKKDKVNKEDNVLLKSDKAFSLVRKLERRSDKKLGIQSLPSPDKRALERVMKVDDLDRFDFGVSDFGLRIRMDIVTAGVMEEFTVTAPSGAGAAQADYLHFTDPQGRTHAVWLDIDDDGTAPTGAHYSAAQVKTEVDIAALDLAAAVAAAIVAAIGAIPNMTITDNLDGTISFASTVAKALPDAQPFNANDSGAGSIGVSIDTQGVDEDNHKSFKSFGLRPGDIVQILSGTLNKREYKVVSLVDDNTARLEDDDDLLAPATNVPVRLRLSGSKHSKS